MLPPRASGQPSALFSLLRTLNLFWHAVFMLLTAAVVIGGVSKGLERWARILMPLLLFMMVALLIKSFTLEGFWKGFDFVFGFHSEQLTAAGVLEALGHAFLHLEPGHGVDHDLRQLSQGG